MNATDLTDHSHKLAGARERMISVKYYTWSYVLLDTLTAVLAFLSWLLGVASSYWSWCITMVEIMAGKLPSSHRFVYNHGTNS